MSRFGVTVTYIASYRFFIEAETSLAAEDIGHEMSLEIPSHDYSLYDVESRQVDDGPVDNED